MKKRIAFLVMAMLMLVSSTVYAVETRAVKPTARLSFDGTTAVCTCSVRGESGDKVEVTMTLYQGTTQVASWSDSGTSRVNMKETKTVTKGKTYTLTVEATVNGKDIPETSVKGTC